MSVSSTGNKHLPRPTAVLWDMDGTLIDQSTPIVRCFAQVITEMGHPEPAHANIHRSMGGTLAETMALFIPAQQVEAACLLFRKHFPSRMYHGLIVLPGGIELIERLHKAGIPQAIFTNKHGPTARALSRHLGFERYITTCIGNQDTEWRKPQAQLTRHVLQQIGARAEGACLIGDSPTDVETAKNAGLRCYTVATGAHSIEEQTQAGADACFPDLSTLATRLLPS